MRGVVLLVAHVQGGPYAAGFIADLNGGETVLRKSEQQTGRSQLLRHDASRSGLPPTYFDDGHACGDDGLRCGQSQGIAAGRLEAHVNPDQSISNPIHRGAEHRGSRRSGFDGSHCLGKLVRVRQPPHPGLRSFAPASAAGPDCFDG